MSVRPPSDDPVPPSAPQPPAPRKRHTGRNVGIGCLSALAAFVVLIIVIVAASSNGGGGNQASKSSPTPPPTAAATPKPTPTAAPTAKPAAAPTAKPAAATPKPAPAPKAPTQILAPISGDGIQDTPPFTAPAHWTITYSFDCSTFGYSGNFVITVMQGTDPVDVPVNALAMSGSKTVDVYDPGQGLHLDINSECSWTVSAQSA